MKNPSHGRFVRFTTLLITLLALLCLGERCVQAQAVVYDAISDLTSFTTTSSVPHTFMGQAFNTSNAGGAMPQVTQVQVGMFVLGAQSFSNVRVRLQLWGSFDPAAAGATNAFSNPLGGGPSVFTIGPVSSTGNSVFLLTLTFGVPITLPSTMNLGITFNFQSSTDGVTYVDETNLATAMRPVGMAGNIPVGQNVTTGGNQYYRNASGRTDFNFNANDARNLGGTQATDGLAFKLTAAVPEPSTWAMIIGGMGMLVFVQRFRRARKA